MEFWTAWALNVKVGQDRAMDKIGLDKYKMVIFLQQKTEDRSGPMGGKPFHKIGLSMGGHSLSGTPMSSQTAHPMSGPPMGRPIPKGFKLIYSSSYFNAYQKVN